MQHKQEKVIEIAPEDHSPQDIIHGTAANNETNVDTDGYEDIDASCVAKFNELKKHF